MYLELIEICCRRIPTPYHTALHIEDSSLSEEIQESDTEFQINHDMNWLPKKSYRLSTSWNLRLRVIGGHSKADIILSMPCQKKQEIRNQESRHFW